MQADTETRQLHAIEAMDALEYLFASLPSHEDVPPRHVAALLRLAHDAVREALPRAAMMLSANDED